MTEPFLLVAMGVMTVTRGRITFVASSLPPSPTSTTPHST